MALAPATNRQVPDHSIMDHFNKQTYLGNRYIYTASNSLSGSSEVALYYLQNPAVTTNAFPSGNIGLFVDHVRLCCATASESVILKMYLNPVISGAGTSETAVNMRPASGNKSISNFQVSPTASSNGTLILSLASNSYSYEISKFLSIIDPGQSLLITVTPSGNCSGIVELGWYEL